MKPLPERSEGELVRSVLRGLTSSEDGLQLYVREPSAEKRSAELPHLLSGVSHLDPRVERVIELLRVLDLTLEEGGIEAAISRLRTPFDALTGQISSLQKGVNTVDHSVQLILNALKSGLNTSDQLAEGIAQLAETVIKNRFPNSSPEDLLNFAKWYSKQDIDDAEDEDEILRKWHIWKRKQG